MLFIVLKMRSAVFCVGVMLLLVSDVAPVTHEKTNFNDLEQKLAVIDIHNHGNYQTKEAWLAAQKFHDEQREAGNKAYKTPRTGFDLCKFYKLNRKCPDSVLQELFLEAQGARSVIKRAAAKSSSQQEKGKDILS